MKKNLIIVAAVLFLLVLTVVITIDLVKSNNKPPEQKADNAPQPVQQPAEAEQRKREDAAIAAAQEGAFGIVQPQAQPAPPQDDRHGRVVLQGNMGIFDIVRTGNVEALRALIEARPSSVNDRDQLGDSPLHHAVGRGREDIMDLLINSKSDLNAKNQQGETPLHTAAAVGKTEMISLLLHHGANPSIRDGKVGMTPLEWAEIFGQREAADVLRQHIGK